MARFQRMPGSTRWVQQPGPRGAWHRPASRYLVQSLRPARRVLAGTRESSIPSPLPLLRRRQKPLPLTPGGADRGDAVAVPGGQTTHRTQQSVDGKTLRTAAVCRFSSQAFRSSLSLLLLLSRMEYYDNFLISGWSHPNRLASAIRAPVATKISVGPKWVVTRPSGRRKEDSPRDWRASAPT